MVAPALMALLPSLIQAGTSMYGASQDRKAQEEQDLLARLQQNPAQNLQGTQMGFSIPGMQSVNGLLGR